MGILRVVKNFVESTTEEKGTKLLQIGVVSLFALLGLQVANATLDVSVPAILQTIVGAICGVSMFFSGVLMIKSFIKRENCETGAKAMVIGAFGWVALVSVMMMTDWGLNQFGYELPNSFGWVQLPFLATFMYGLIKLATSSIADAYRRA